MELKRIREKLTSSQGSGQPAAAADITGQATQD
jgi:hypothetical protein